MVTCLLLATGTQALQSWRARLEREARDEMNAMKTRLELSAQMRLLQQYYLSNGNPPQNPSLYLRPYLKDNKPFPKGCDFWGHPYRVDSYWNFLGVRSAGPNGKMDDRDDLVMGMDPSKSGK